MELKNNPKNFAVKANAKANGFVSLVGAGSGDPDLLTLKAVKAIAGADVVLVDDLVHPEVLTHKSAKARVVYVGKRGGCASTSQAFIERLMVREARAGLRVVRLKGGDPLIFGRAGEEIAALQSAGVAHEVVNGITAGLAAGAGIGISLTHRDLAHGVMWVTGHASNDEHAIDWAHMGAAAHALRQTVVIYMGLSRVSEIQAGLLQALPAYTPVAIVNNAVNHAVSHSQVFTRLDGLSETVAREQIKSPAVMVIGDVVATASQFIAEQALQAFHAHLDQNAHDAQGALRKFA